MIVTQRVILISLGLFLGLLSYGFQTTLVKYNHLVNPQPPLQVITVEKEGGEVNFMGERLTLPPDINFVSNELFITLNKLQETAGVTYHRLAEECQLLLDKYGY